MPAPARKPGPASEADAVIKRRFFFSMCCSIGAAGFRPSSPAHDRFLLVLFGPLLFFSFGEECSKGFFLFFFSFFLFFFSSSLSRWPEGGESHGTDSHAGLGGCCWAGTLVVP